MIRDGEERENLETAGPIRGRRKTEGRRLKTRQINVEGDCGLEAAVVRTVSVNPLVLVWNTRRNSLCSIVPCPQVLNETIRRSFDKSGKEGRFVLRADAGVGYLELFVRIALHGRDAKQSLISRSGTSVI